MSVFSLRIYILVGTSPGRVHGVIPIVAGIRCIHHIGDDFRSHGVKPCPIELGNFGCCICIVAFQAMDVSGDAGCTRLLCAIDVPLGHLMVRRWRFQQVIVILDLDFLFSHSLTKSANVVQFHVNRACACTHKTDVLDPSQEDLQGA